MLTKVKINCLHPKKYTKFQFENRFKILHQNAQFARNKLGVIQLACEERSQPYWLLRKMGYQLVTLDFVSCQTVIYRIHTVAISQKEEETSHYKATSPVNQTFGDTNRLLKKL